MYKSNSTDKKNNPRYKIGKNLKKFRGTISRGVLAQKASLSVLQLLKMEKNKNANPTIETLFRVANALGKKVEDFFK